MKRFLILICLIICPFSVWSNWELCHTGDPAVALGYSDGESLFFTNYPIPGRIELKAFQTDDTGKTWKETTLPFSKATIYSHCIDAGGRFSRVGSKRRS